MSTTITIRTHEELRRRLEERAEAAGTSISALVREILEAAVSDQPLGRRAGALRGRLQVSEDTRLTWRESLRERNWRP